MNRAVFLDRDGVINKGFPYTGKRGDPANYVLSWDQFEWMDGSIDGMQILADAGYTLIVVSNQACVGYGLISYNEAEAIFARMARQSDIELYWYFCPHLSTDNCACRKPKPGMIYQAAIEHEIDLSRSWMVGDSWSDAQSAFKSGIPAGQIVAIAEKGCILDTSYKTLCADTLLEAAKIITGDSIR